jgi:predicted NACHT family NTPase
VLSTAADQQEEGDQRQLASVNQIFSWRKYRIASRLYSLPSDFLFWCHAMTSAAIFFLITPHNTHLMPNIKQWAKDNPGLLGLFGVVFGSFLTTVAWPALQWLLGHFSAFIKSLTGRRGGDRIYLSAVIDQHRFLPILPSTLFPVTADHHIKELDSVYVTLTLSQGGDDSFKGTIAEALVASRRMIILGDPGSGKTTLLRYLTLTLARARARFYRDTFDPSGSTEKSRTARSRVRHEYGLTHSPVPIFIYLNRFTDAAGWPASRALISYLREGWQQLESTGTVVPAAMERHIENGDCVFILDAFDELPTSEARDRVADLISKLCETASHNRFIVSSRTASYHGQLTQSGFVPYVIQRLSWAAIEQLVTKWYAALETPQKTAQLLDALHDNPRLEDLAQNPMLLSLIVLVQYSLPLIPDKRHVLYEECLRVLIERRYAPATTQASYNEVLPADEALSILREVSFALQKNRMREIHRDSLENEILPRILSDMPLTKAYGLSPSMIISNIEERSHLLIERGFDNNAQSMMALSHLTFQEYLASKHLFSLLASEGKAKVMNTLLSLYTGDPQWWEETAILFAAQLDPRDQRDFLDAVKSTSP